MSVLASPPAHNSSCSVTAGKDEAGQPAAHQQRLAAQLPSHKSTAALEPTSTTAVPTLRPGSQCLPKPAAKRKWWQQSHAGRQTSLPRTSSNACARTSTVKTAPPEAQGAVATTVQQQAACDLTVRQQQASEAAGAGRAAQVVKAASTQHTAGGDVQHDSTVVCRNTTGSTAGGGASAVRVNSSAAGHALGARGNPGRWASCITLVRMPQVITLGSLLAVRDAPIKQQVQGCKALQAAARTQQHPTVMQAAARTPQHASLMQVLQQQSGAVIVSGGQQQRQETTARWGDGGHPPLGVAAGIVEQQQQHHHHHQHQQQQQQQRQVRRQVVSSSVQSEEGELSCEEGELCSEEEGQLVGNITQQGFLRTAVSVHQQPQQQQQQHHQHEEQQQQHHQGQQQVPWGATGQPPTISVARKQQKPKSRAGRQVRDRKQRAAAERAASGAADSASASGEAGRVEVQAGLAADIRKWEKAQRVANQHQPKAVDPARDLRFTILSEKPPCSFWHQGRCTKGTACTFSHAGRPAIHLLPCKFHQAGRCAKGNTCRFSHEQGCVAPCRQLLLYGRCKVEACAAKHEALDPFIAQALRQYFLHLEQVDHDKQQQQGKHKADEPQIAAGRGCKRRRKKSNTQQQQQQQQHLQGGLGGIDCVQQAAHRPQAGQQQPYHYLQQQHPQQAIVQQQQQQQPQHYLQQQHVQQQQQDVQLQPQLITGLDNADVLYPAAAMHPQYGAFLQQHM